MKHKTLKNLWIVVALIGVLAMIMFTIMPAFQF
jgi:hypothetical protein